jgi:DNA (cytosine-5)-methyltransferase 1
MAVSVREQLLEKRKKLTYAPRLLGFRSTFRLRQRERSNSFKQIAQKEINRLYDVPAGTLQDSALFDEAYFISARGLFDARKRTRRPKPNGEDGLYRVAVTDSGAKVAVAFSRIGLDQNGSREVSVCMTGLAKYLGRIDELRCVGEIFEAKDIFHLWKAVEDVLVSRSRFFTLIDIYGHYANRGDTIRVTTSIERSKSDAMLRAVEFFGVSENCGGFVAKRALGELLDLERPKLVELIDQLRGIRFDVRTEQTHPIIGKGRVICTYPFPLLSRKALVESKIQLLSRAQQEILL